jgi:hypothetical protein
MIHQKFINCPSIYRPFLFVLTKKHLCFCWEFCRFEKLTSGYIRQVRADASVPPLGDFSFKCEVFNDIRMKLYILGLHLNQILIQHTEKSKNVILPSQLFELDKEVLKVFLVL